VKGDAFLIEQAVTNLVKNAIEHADRESNITILAERNNSGRVTISVTNEGQNIPEYALPHLFDRFYSLPNREGNKGSGIGLSFVKEIAQLHGGDVKVDSENNLTRFEMTI
jgi:two-component system sensor histidine kinase CreC